MRRAARPADAAFRRPPFRHLARRRSDRAELLASVNGAGEVAVEGEPIGRLDGFRFKPDARRAEAAAGGGARRVARRDRGAGAAARRGARRANCALAADGAISWRGQAIARLAAGEDSCRRESSCCRGDISKARRARPCAAASPISSQAELRRAPGAAVRRAGDWSVGRGARDPVPARRRAGRGAERRHRRAARNAAADERKALARRGLRISARFIFIARRCSSRRRRRCARCSGRWRTAPACRCCLSAPPRRATPPCRKNFMPRSASSCWASACCASTGVETLAAALRRLRARAVRGDGRAGEARRRTARRNCRRCCRPGLSRGRRRGGRRHLPCAARHARRSAIARRRGTPTAPRSPPTIPSPSSRN